MRAGWYAEAIFTVIQGWVGMTNPADFEWIVPGFADAIRACYASFQRSDYLLATFLLVAIHEKRQVTESTDGTRRDFGFRINVHEPKFAEMGLERFCLGDYDGEMGRADYASYIVLDGEPIAVWRARMTTSYDRNWVEVLPGADEQILDAVGTPPAAREACRAS